MPSSRSTAARSAARAHLSALRAARRSRRRRGDETILETSSLPEACSSDLGDAPQCDDPVAHIKAIATDTAEVQDPYVEATDAEVTAAVGMDEVTPVTDLPVEESVFPSSSAEVGSAGEEISIADKIVACEVAQQASVSGIGEEAPPEIAPDMMSDTEREESESSLATLNDDVADAASRETLESEREMAPEDTAPGDTAPEASEDHAPYLLDQSPLFELPGAGPGLVWMLTRAGVETIEDLATAEPNDLAQRLGLVGEILDLGAWITWARRQTED